MSDFQSDLVRIFHERGLFYQCTDIETLDKLASQKVLTGYCGFDPTAESLHIGNLVPIMMLRRLQQAGHKPIVLVGGGTAKVGDPSGKDETRQLMDDARLQKNIAGIKSTFSRFIKFGDGPTDAILVDNADWLDQLDYIPFLREIGVHFSVNRMIAMDSVRLRLEREQHMSFLEFNYSLMQAYDYLELFRKHNCILQLSGADQWGNIISGVELIRRVDGKESYGLTAPLITKADGSKMGKSVSGAIWLNPDMLSPYDYWQFWRNVDDRDVGKMMRIFTDIPLDEIERLEKLEGAELNEAKKILANEATAICHGKEAADEAAATAQKTFEQGGSAEGLPSIEIGKAELEAGILVTDLFRRAGLAESNGEVKRLIKGGGARVNDVAVENDQEKISLAALNDEGAIKLSSGKKKHALVKLVS